MESEVESIPGCCSNLNLMSVAHKGGFSDSIGMARRIHEDQLRYEHQGSRLAEPIGTCWNCQHISRRWHDWNGAKWCNSFRHKEVEAALEAGFNPDYTDSFGDFAKKGAVTARHGDSLWWSLPLPRKLALSHCVSKWEQKDCKAGGRLRWWADGSVESAWRMVRSLLLSLDLLRPSNTVETWTRRTWKVRPSRLSRYAWYVW